VGSRTRKSPRWLQWRTREQELVARCVDGAPANRAQTNVAAANAQVVSGLSQTKRRYGQDELVDNSKAGESKDKVGVWTPACGLCWATPAFVEAKSTSVESNKTGLHKWFSGGTSGSVAHWTASARLGTLSAVARGVVLSSNLHHVPSVMQHIDVSHRVKHVR